MALTKHDYERALLSQSACNASGLIHTMAELAPRIREEVQSTDGVNNHPIMRLYIEQLKHLCPRDYFEADKICRGRAEGAEETEENSNIYVSGDRVEVVLSRRLGHSLQGKQGTVLMRTSGDLYRVEMDATRQRHLFTVAELKYAP